MAQPRTAQRRAATCSGEAGPGIQALVRPGEILLYRTSRSRAETDAICTALARGAPGEALRASKDLDIEAGKATTAVLGHDAKYVTTMLRAQKAGKTPVFTSPYPTTAAIYRSKSGHVVGTGEPRDLVVDPVTWAIFVPESAVIWTNSRTYNTNGIFYALTYSDSEVVIDGRQVREILHVPTALIEGISAAVDGLAKKNILKVGHQGYKDRDPAVARAVRDQVMDLRMPQTNLGRPFVEVPIALPGAHTEILIKKGDRVLLVDGQVATVRNWHPIDNAEAREKWHGNQPGMLDLGGLKEERAGHLLSKSRGAGVYPGLVAKVVPEGATVSAKERAAVREQGRGILAQWQSWWADRHEQALATGGDDWQRARWAAEATGARAIQAELQGTTEARMTKAHGHDGDDYFCPLAWGQVEEETGHNSRTILVHLHPEDFLDLALPGKDKEKQTGVEDVLQRGSRFRDVPRLLIENNGDGTAQVVGHEGRHRSRALQARGVIEMPVRLHCREGGVGGALRWDRVPLAARPHVLISENGRKRVNLDWYAAAARLRAPRGADLRASAQKSVDLQMGLYDRARTFAETARGVGREAYDALEVAEGAAYKVLPGVVPEVAPFIPAMQAVSKVRRRIAESVGAANPAGGTNPAARLVINPNTLAPEPGLAIQSLLFDRKSFTKRAAVAWVKEHGFTVHKPAEGTKNYWRVRQGEPDQFEKKSFRTKEIREGVKAVFARPTAAPAALAARLSKPETSAFRKWFGHSKVVDNEGNPLVVYHASPAEFREFRRGDPGFDRFGPGFYFTGDPKTIDTYSQGGTGKVYPVYLRIENPTYGGMTPDQIDAFFGAIRTTVFSNGYNAAADHASFRERAHADPQNAFNMLAESAAFKGYFTEEDVLAGLRAAGIDGAMIPVYGHVEYVVFSPNQIKAVDNEGTFDPNTADIYRMRKPPGRGGWDPALAFDTHFRYSDAVAALPNGFTSAPIPLKVQVMEEVAWEAGYELASQGKKILDPTGWDATLSPYDSYAQSLGADLKKAFLAGYNSWG